MLSSLFSGISGVKNSQAQMDVIANNIANVNTTGFKSSRITFADSLLETISGAKGTAGNFGGANPMQIGRGAVISSIDTQFKQGSLDSTGMITDVALNGKGFFIMKDLAGNTFYSRAGAFQIDDDGKLLAQGGSHYIQGRIADEKGNLSSTTKLQNIVLPFGRKDPAKATTNIDLWCNLDKSSTKTEEWLSGQALTSNSNPASLSTNLRDVDGNIIYRGDEIMITGSDKNGETINGTFVYGNRTGSFEHTDPTETVGTDSELVADVAGFFEGDVIAITGVNTDGTYFTESLTIAADTTVGDLLNTLNGINGVTANLDSSGNLILTGQNSGNIEITGLDLVGNGTTIANLITTINQTYSSFNPLDGTLSADGSTAMIDQNGNLRLIANQGGDNETTIFMTAGPNNWAATNNVYESHSLTGLESRLIEDLGYTAGDEITITLGAVDVDYEVVADSTVADLLSAFQGHDDVTSMTLNPDGSITIEGTNGTYNITDDTADGGFFDGLEIIVAGGEGDSVALARLALLANDSLLTDNLGYSAGDRVFLSGTTPSGTVVTAPDFIISEDSTMQDLINHINAHFTGITASLSADGELIISDNNPGASLTDLVMTTTTNSGPLHELNTDSDRFALTTEGTDSSAIVIPAFSEIVDGSYGKHSTEITVYDNMGNRHSIELRFTQNPDISRNEWRWEAIINNGKVSPLTGGSGSVTFNSDGSLKAFSYDNGKSLIFNVPGAEQLNIKITPGTSGLYDGITQTTSPSTTIAVEQDGYTLGSLANISIDDQGIVSGIYTNGNNRTLAQIALANFTNEGGLMKEGNSMFSANESSGSPIISWSGSNTNTVVRAGYLESSNVDLTQEFANMIISERSLQANAKVIATSDMILTTIIDRIKRG